MDTSEGAPLGLDKYYIGYWIPLSKAVDQLLQCSTQPSARVSFEQMYSTVYKCVCDGYAEKLHSDLLSHCRKFLESVHTQLESIDPSQLVPAFHDILAQYLPAVQQVTPIFGYMNKFYVEMNLQTSLQTELFQLFCDVVAEPRLPTIMGMIEECLSKPFTIPPAILSSLFKNLYILNCNYSQRYSHIFSRYVPNVLPPMKETELPSYIEETRQLQEQLRQEGFVSGNQNLKRRGDDENYGPQYGMAVQSETTAIHGGIS